MISFVLFKGILSERFYPSNGIGLGFTVSVLILKTIEGDFLLNYVTYYESSIFLGLKSKDTSLLFLCMVVGGAALCNFLLNTDFMSSLHVIPLLGRFSVVGLVLGAYYDNELSIKLFFQLKLDKEILYNLL